MPAPKCGRYDQGRIDAPVLAAQALASSGPVMTRAMLSRTVVQSLAFASALVLGGCWSAPVANVQPKGEPRLIQSAIAVRSIKNPEVVQSVDTGTRTIVVLTPGTAGTNTYKVGQKVSSLDRVKAGDRIRATVAEELTVYVLHDGQLPGVSSPETIATDAKVLSVDPSYRLLTVQYPDGRNETFKVAKEVKLKQMEAGDDVVIRVIEVISLRVQKR
jgi:hypothetical protein